MNYLLFMNYAELVRKRAYIIAGYRLEVDDSGIGIPASGISVRYRSIPNI